jgi:hypothetical protein
MYGNASDNFHGDFFDIASVSLSDYEQQSGKIKIHKGIGKERKSPRGCNDCFGCLLGCHVHNVFTHSEVINWAL